MISTRSLFPVLNGAPPAEKSAKKVILFEKKEPEKTYEEIKKQHAVDKIFRLSVFLTDKNALIFVYCRTGVRSSAAAHSLVDMGYTSIYDISGGITSWTYDTVSGSS